MTAEQVREALREYPPDNEVIVLAPPGGGECVVDEVVSGALPRTVLVLLGSKTMSQTVEFKFAIGMMVAHVDYEIKGSVIGLWMDRDAIRWVQVERVKADGELTTDWLRESVLIEMEG